MRCKSGEERQAGGGTTHRGVTSRRRQKRGKSRDDVFLYILALKNMKSNQLKLIFKI
jgi:hypothetical protein